MTDLRIFNFLILNLLLVIGAVAQSVSIVDDSTVTNISLDQTSYFLKSDVFVGDTIKRPIVQEERFDIFRYNFVKGELTQNLGMYASASLNSMQPYNKRIGSYDGITVYEHLMYKDSDLKYYDTKVPYSFVSFRQNFGGVSYADGGYTQSIKEVGNIGVEVKRSATPLNLGSNPNNIRFSENTGAKAHASYLAKSGKYKVLVNYRFMKNTVEENGGVDFEPSDGPVITNKDSIITEDFIETQLGIETVFTQEKVNEVSFYHELSPFENGEIKLFHELNRTKKVNSYLDAALATNLDYYPVINDSTRFLQDTVTALQDSNVYRVLENKVGINGKVGQISYSGFVKNRSWIYESDTNRWDTATVVVKRVNDVYVGGDLFFQTKSRDIKALLNLEFGFDKTSRIELNTDLKYLRLSYLTLSNKPGLKLQNFEERHHSWGNDFSNYFVTDLKVEPYYESEKLKASAFYKLQTYKDYVYYSDELLPVQDQETRTVNYFGGDISVRFNKWKLSQHVQVANLNDVEFVEVPELYAQTNIDYSFRVKGLSALKTNMGLDVIYFSKYTPLAYRSDLQSFVAQNEFSEDAYVKLDVYVNFRYKTFQLSLKGINLLQGAVTEGYYTTVGYFGKKRAVELGIKWSFFR